MKKHKRILTAIIMCAALFLTSCYKPPQASNKENATNTPNTSFGKTPKMCALSTQELIPGIFAVKSGIANFYLVKSGDSYIAVDTGELSGDLAVKELDSLGISSDEVVAVLLTHTHYDHIGAINMFDKATVYIGYDQSGSWESLSDGEVIEILGIQVQCFYASGHAINAACYLIDGKYLFSGDTLSLDGDHVKMFFSTYNLSDRKQKEDIIMLSKLEGIEYVFTAHHGYTDNPAYPQTD
jgi:glyoxylase-like metal-dependent hydrolase (beta-lactamase superfamily II)